MTETTHMGDHDRARETLTKLRTRERISSRLIPILFIAGFALIILSADQVPGPLAVYLGGISLCLTGAIFVVAWGAAGGHGDLIEYANADHRLLYQLLSERVDGVETYEREQCDLLGRVVDEVGQARDRRQR